MTPPVGDDPAGALPDAVAAGILDAAARALPGEACGVLLGERGNGVTCIRAQRPVPNEAGDATRRFAIAAARVHEEQRRAQREGLDVVGFWHSHPRGPGAPSLADLEEALPGYLYAIADVRTGMLTLWRLRDDRRAFEPADA